MLPTSTTLFRLARSSVPCPIARILPLGVALSRALASVIRYSSEGRTQRIFDLLRTRELAPKPGGCIR